MDDIDRIKNSLAHIEQLLDERRQLKKIMLPTWPENKRAIPNSFLRSALFSAVQSKDRQYQKKAILFSQNGILIRYTGQQLNQEDLTLWETLLHLIRNQPLGNICQFSAFEILKAMKLSTSKSDYERLDCGITRLMACVVEITYRDIAYSRSLIESIDREKKTGLYQIQLNLELIKLYGDSHWTAIDWEQRLKLRKKPLAQILHSYFSSHQKPYPVTLLFLQRLTGSKNKQFADFKRKVISALNELVKIEFLDSFVIKDDLVSVIRNSGKKLSNEES